MVGVSRVVYSGRGLVAALCASAFVAVHALAETFYYKGYYYEHKGWILLAGALAVIPAAVFGVLWNRERVVYDRDTRRSIRTRNQHTMFWLPLQYWAIAFALYTLVELARSH